MNADTAAPCATIRRPAQPVHWVGDYPTSLHGNGAASFERTTRNEAEATCRLCKYLLLTEPVSTPSGQSPPGAG